MSISENLIYLGDYYGLYNEEKRDDPFRLKVIFGVKRNSDVRLDYYMMSKDDVIEEFSQEMVCQMNFITEVSIIFINILGWRTYSFTQQGKRISDLLSSNSKTR